MTMDDRYIDMEQTGLNIKRLREEAGLSVADLQIAFGFTNTQAIYRWQQGRTLPTLDHMMILADLLNVTVEDIVITNW